VIRVLEDHQVPVDMIAGTSMGAFVGALYASGKSANEIEHIVGQVDWAEVFRPDSPRDDLSFRRKLQEDSFLVRYRLGLEDGRIVFPKGIVPGYRLNLTLQNLFRPSSVSQAFDDLPIPFRAVATDLQNGEEVILDSGDLATAVYISMAVPGLMPPVEFGGRILVDGGLANNIPVSVVRAMGADIVIAVDVGSPFRGRNELDSLISVLDQTIRLLVAGNAVATLKTLTADDVLITPELQGIVTADFARMLDAVSEGENAARAMSERLVERALTSEQYAHYRARVRPQEVSAPSIDFIQIENDSRLSDEVIRARIRAEPGKPLQRDELSQDLARLSAMDTFERVDYKLVKTGGETGLVINAQAKPDGGDFVQFGLGISDNLDDDSQYNAGAGFTITDLNRLGGEWRTELNVGSRPRFFSEFYQPVDDRERYFVVPSVEFLRRDLKIRDGNQTLSEIQVDTLELGLGVGRNFDNWGAVQLSFLRSTGEFETKVGTPRVDGNLNSGSLGAQFAYDTLDNLNFPHSGAQGRLELTAVREPFGARNNYNIAVGGAQRAATWGRTTLLSGLSGGTAFDGDVSLADFFELGGFLRLSGTEPGDFAGQYFGFGRLVVYHQIRGDQIPSLVNVPIYLGGSLEAGRAWAARSDITFNSLVFASSAFVGMDTFLGPVYFGGGLTDNGNSSLYLFVGPVF
jgi:NTE family protein